MDRVAWWAAADGVAQSQHNWAAEHKLCNTEIPVRGVYLCDMRTYIQQTLVYECSQLLITVNNPDIRQQEPG